MSFSKSSMRFYFIASTEQRLATCLAPIFDWQDGLVATPKGYRGSGQDAELFDAAGTCVQDGRTAIGAVYVADDEIPKKTLFAKQLLIYLAPPLEMWTDQKPLNINGKSDQTLRCATAWPA